VNKAQRQFKKWLNEDKDCKLYVDKVTCRASGMIELRRHYFYQMGKTPKTFAAEVAKVLLAGWEVFASKNEWRVWPKDSYWVVYIQKVANWCPVCAKSVEPEGQVDARGMYSTCSCCGTELS